MADSLQDQLKALGLAKEKKPERKKPAKRKARAGKPRAQKDGGEMALGKAWALREREEKQGA